MFRDELKEKLKLIFGFAKVSFESHGNTYEQDTMFVEISDCKSRITRGLATARVTGTLIVFSNKMKFGYESKRLGMRDSIEAAKKIFLYDIDQDIASSPARLVNISERRTKFLYLYDAPYNPALHQLQGFDSEIAVPETPLIDIGDGSNLDVGDGRVLST